MKTPAYRIKFTDNTHAILAERLFEEEHDIVVDCRQSNQLVFSTESLRIEKMGLMGDDPSADDFIKRDIDTALDDILCVGEYGYQPEIEAIDFDFDEEENSDVNEE